MELEYCMICGKLNPPDRPVCKCGGEDFVFGNNFSYENKKVICNCGNDQFKMSTHMDFSNYSNTTYVCTKCSNAVATQIHRKDDWMSDY